MRKLLLLLPLILLLSCGRATMDVKPPADLTLPCAIYYDSEHCGWCKSFRPSWERAKSEIKGVTYYENVHDEEFGIQAVPAVVFVSKDGTVFKTVGYRSYRSLRNNLNRIK